MRQELKGICNREDPPASAAVIGGNGSICHTLAVSPNSSVFLCVASALTQDLVYGPEYAFTQARSSGFWFLVDQKNDAKKSYVGNGERAEWQQLRK